MTRSENEVDQIVFRWDSENLTGNTGFGPVAWSGPRDEAGEIFQIFGPVLRASGDETRPALIRLRRRAHVTLIRRLPFTDADGGTSVLCHALVGAPNLLRPSVCLGLHGWDWEGAAAVRAAEARGLLPVVPEEALGPAASRGQAELDRLLPYAAEELVGTVAEFLRHPDDRFTVLDERGDTAHPVLWGLHSMLGALTNRPWTFATHDTVELPALRFAFVGRWSGAASRNTERRRVDPRERCGDRAEEIAARLVRHHLGEVEEGKGRDHVVGRVLHTAASAHRGPLLETAARAADTLDSFDHRGSGRGPRNRTAPDPRDQAGGDPWDQAGGGSRDQAGQGSRDQAGQGSRDQAGQGSRDQAGRDSRDQGGWGPGDQGGWGPRDSDAPSPRDQGASDPRHPDPAGSQHPAPQYPDPAGSQYPAPQYPDPAGAPYPEPRHPDPAGSQYPGDRDRRHPDAADSPYPAAPGAPYPTSPGPWSDASGPAPGPAPSVRPERTGPAERPVPPGRRPESDDGRGDSWPPGRRDTPDGHAPEPPSAPSPAAPRPAPVREPEPAPEPAYAPEPPPTPVPRPTPVPPPTPVRPPAPVRVPTHEPQPPSEPPYAPDAPPRQPGGAYPRPVLPLVGPQWTGPGPGARRPPRRPRGREREEETRLVHKLPTVGSVDEARELVRRGGSRELLDALRRRQAYAVVTVLLAEIARRLPSWEHPLRRELCEVVIGQDLWAVPPPTARDDPSEPAEEQRAANAAELHRWAVRPLLGGGDAPVGTLAELLSHLRTSPAPSAREAFWLIVDGERPGLPDAVWLGLLKEAYGLPRTAHRPGPAGPPVSHQDDLGNGYTRRFLRRAALLIGGLVVAIVVVGVAKWAT
ncbi:hypothetical protein ACN9M0_28200 [Streptomyces sp. R-07]|uniref:hypothetical protein n=1 Tax=Streptomyces sp. R-07 TaxID=3404052 RepID=UPI003CECEA8C